MAYQLRYKLRVEFAHTDMAGIVHFSNFFRYMEETEHAFLRSLGLSVHDKIDGRVVSWPRVSARCTYRAPLRFGDQFEVHLLVRGKRSSSIAYEFLFYKGDGDPIAQGAMEVVCASLDPSTGRMTAIPIPPSIGEKIEAAPEGLVVDASRSCDE